MYIVSLRLDKKKVLGVAAALCLLIAVVCVVVPRPASDVLSSNISTSAKSIEEHIAFLNAYGYNVSEKPVQIQEIVIPEEFSSEYEKYNEYQKLSGFDLSKFKSYRVKKYTYKVLNYEDSQDEVVANVIVYNDKVIGGDISSTTLGGFVHGFVKE